VAILSSIYIIQIKTIPTNFCTWVNLGLQDMTAIGWDALALLTNFQAKGNKKRQHKFKDFGMTAGQCTDDG
jgi:hypothetical protein